MPNDRYHSKFSYSDVEVKSDEIPGYLIYIRDKSGVSLSDESIAFKAEVQKVAEIIVQLCTFDQTRRRYFFDHLRDAAREGLIGDSASIVDGRDILQSLKQNLISHGLRMNRWQLVMTTIFLIFWIGLAVSMIFLVQQADAGTLASSAVSEFVMPAKGLILAILYSMVGVSLSVCVAEFWRFKRFNFDNIAISANYGIGAILFVWILTLLSSLIILLIYYDVVQIGVLGSLQLSRIKEEPTLGFAVGVLCGLAEPATSSLLTQLAPTGRATNDGESTR